MTKPILCLDFDGVLHCYTSGWKGADVITDPPVPGMLTFLLSVIDEFDVCILSSRSHQPGGISAMKAWLKSHAGNSWYDSPAGRGLENITFPTIKPPAMVTIDDRALTFTGVFPSVSQLKSFKPWNK